MIDIFIKSIKEAVEKTCLEYKLCPFCMWHWGHKTELKEYRCRLCGWEKGERI